MDTNLEINLSLEKLLTNIETARADLVTLKAEVESTTKKIKEGFESGAGSVGEMEKQLSQNITRIRAQSEEIKKMQATISALHEQQAKGFDPTKLEEYKKKIAGLETELDNLKKKTQANADGLDDMGDSLEIQGGAIGKFRDKLKGLLLSLTSVTAATLLIKGVIDLFKGWGEAIFGLSDAQKDQLEVQKAVNSAIAEGQKSVVKQRLELESLLVVARDLNQSDEQRVLAIRQMNELLPDTVLQITKENVASVEVTAAIDEYILGLERKGRAQAYQNTIQKFYNELIEMESLLTEDLSTQYGHLADKIDNQIRKDIDRQKAKIDATKSAYLTELQNGTALLDLDKARLARQKDFEKAGAAGAKVIGNINADNKKASQEQAKADREEEARKKRILDLEKQLAALKAEALGEGRQKDIAEEKARFENAIRTLEALKKARNVSEEETKLLNQVIEANRKKHFQTLRDIDAKYYEDAVKAFTTAQDNINAVLLKDEEAELKQIEAKYKKLFSAITEAKKSIGEGSDPRSALAMAMILAGQEKALKEKNEKDIFDAGVKWDLKRLEEEEKLSLALIDIMKIEGLKGQDLLDFREGQRLKSIIAFAKKRIALLEKVGTAESKLEIALIKKAIEDAEKEITGLGKKLSSPENKIHKFFKDLFNTDDEGLKNLGEALKSVGELMGEITASIELQIDRRITAIDKEIEKYDELISKAEESVDRQRSLAEQGYANDLSLEERRLADLKRLRDNEVKQKEAQQKKLEEIRKAGAILAISERVESIITTGVKLQEAAAKIFAANSGIPLVGVITALGMVASMVASFLAIKNQIQAATRDVPKLRKGGSLEDVLRGRPSHEAGGVGLYDEVTGEKLAEVEGDEHIVKKGAATKYRKILNAMNRDELSNWTFEDLKQFIKPTGIQFSRSQEQAPDTKVIVVSDSSNSKMLERIARSNEEILFHERQKETRTENDEQIVITKGNVSKIIKKKKNG